MGDNGVSTPAAPLGAVGAEDYYSDHQDLQLSIINKIVIVIICNNKR